MELGRDEMVVAKADPAIAETAQSDKDEGNTRCEQLEIAELRKPRTKLRLYAILIALYVSSTIERTTTRRRLTVPASLHCSLQLSIRLSLPLRYRL